jgi:hypothetical protein
MPSRVARVFAAYITLSQRRSLKLLAEVKELPSIATLKRWSARYQWQARRAAHDLELAEQMLGNLTRAETDKRLNDLKAIESAKDRFYQRVLIDPNDGNLTAAQRRRALKLTVSDYCKLVKLKYSLITSPETIVDREVAAREPYTGEEIKAMMRALAQVRHRLPTV